MNRDSNGEHVISNVSSIYGACPFTKFLKLHPSSHFLLSLLSPPLFRNHNLYNSLFNSKTMRSSSSFGLAASTVVAISLLASTAVVNAACSTRSNVITTFYGYPDNDPPGPATAYNCGGRNNIAGGKYIYIFFFTSTSSSPPIVDYFICLFICASTQSPPLLPLPPKKRKTLNRFFFHIFWKNRYWNLRQPSYVCQCSWRVHFLRNHLLSLFEKISPFRGFLRSV